MSSLPRQVPPRSGHMIVCGDDGLAYRLSDELREVYSEHVTLVAPTRSGVAASTSPAGRDRATALFGRVSTVMTRVAGTAPDAADDGQVLEASEVTDEVLAAAGVARAAALALVYEDDEVNIRTALVARRLNPRLRLVIRLYNRKLGQHLEELLDQAAAVAVPGLDLVALDASTTVLSDADTAAPALAATAVAGTSKVVQADGLLLRAVERTPPRPRRGRRPRPVHACPAVVDHQRPRGRGGFGQQRPGGAPLLPDDGDGGRCHRPRHGGRWRPSSHAGRRSARRSADGPGRCPLGSLFSRRLRWSLAGLVGRRPRPGRRLLADHRRPPRCTPPISPCSTCSRSATRPSASPWRRQVIQLLSGLAGLLLLPVLLAAALEALGTFRNASALRRPPRGLSGHVVLLGLGKIGTRVLARLRNSTSPWCAWRRTRRRAASRSPGACASGRSSGTSPQEGVLEAAKIHRAHALLALTSSTPPTSKPPCTPAPSSPTCASRCACTTTTSPPPSTAPCVPPTPDALTRSRSVSTLAAPAFAGAMMGRQILGAIPVERRVLLFAALDVAGHPQLEGRTVAEAFRPGAWRVIALDAAPPRTGVPISRRPTGRRRRPACRPRLGSTPRLRSAARGPGGAGRHPPGPGRTARPPPPTGRPRHTVDLLHGAPGLDRCGSR